MKLGKIKAHFGVEVLILDRLGAESRVKVGRNSGHVVGDEVQITHERLKRLKRHNSLSRKTNFGNQTLAANLTYVAIVLSVTPKTTLKFIDQIIISCRLEKIRPIIILTKFDLDDSHYYLEQIKKNYQNSVPILAGLENLQIFIKKNPGRYILLGVSGTGKSTLINKLVPDLAQKQKIGKLGDNQKTGKHTTSCSLLIELENNSELIDSPGVRDFTPIDLNIQDAARYFPGFEEFSNQPCKFRNCRHLKEPACVIRENTQPKVYERYLALFSSED